MRRLLRLTVLGIGVAATSAATAQGPVREGLRRTGEIAAEGTQRVIQGTEQVIQGTAQATRSVGEATLNTADAAARGVGRGVDAVTPDVPLQARANANLSEAEQRRDARWRFARHNNEWWYYGPENRWMYHRNGQWNQFAEDQFQPPAQPEHRHAMGYRGVDSASQVDPQMQANQSPQFAQQLRTDRWGRQFICDNGRPVYLDRSGSDLQPVDHQQQEPQAADGTQDYAPPRPAEAGPAAESSVVTESQAEQQSRGVPAEPNPGDADSAGNAPESPREINNNPAPASGTGADTGAAKVQTPQ